MKKILLFLLLASFSSHSAQNLNSIFDEYVKLKQPEISEGQEILGHPVSDNKCGFQTAAMIREHFDEFSPEQKVLLKTLAGRPTRQNSVVSPKGYFRVHYDTSGNNAIAYSLEELLIALDSSYTFEVTFLGYDAPPVDNNEGGDNLYDVYVSRLNSGTYGYTEFEEDLPGNRHTSYMMIDNDFANLFTSGIDGARVTVAHEFHHAIQIGNYLFRGDDTYYYEISSTAMEEFVYDDINDYYNYMGSYFAQPHKTISKNNGYNLAILNLFLQQKFDHDLLKRIWEIMIEKPFLYAMDDALVERESSLKEEFNHFGTWTFFTGRRAREGYFEEAEFYPLVTPVTSMEFEAPSAEIMVSTAPVTNNYVMFTTATDTIIALVTNADITSGVSSIYSLTQFDYGLYDTQVEGSARLDDNFYALFSSDEPDIFADIAFINNDFPIPLPAETNGEPYPLPFSYSIHTLINIPVIGVNGDEVYLNVYSTGLELVADKIAILYNGIVTWDAKTENGDKLPTGVYIYVFKNGDEVNKGKLVIFND